MIPPQAETIAKSSREEIERICARNLLSSSEERVFFKDLRSRFLLVSEGWLRTSAPGCSLEDVIGKTDFDIFDRTHATAAFKDEQRIIRTGEPLVAKVERETFVDRRDRWMSTTKLPLLDDDGEIIGTYGLSRDITEQVHAQEALAEQALRDSLTGLANRVALIDRLTQALVALDRRPGRVGLLFVDLDDFKEVNDMLGHEHGDRVLSEVGRRLERVARRSDTVARLGGDEFVVLCPELPGDGNLRMLSDRILDALRQPFVDGVAVTVAASVGAASTSDPSVEPAELLKRADLAMYGAKRAGQGRFACYDPAVHGRAAAGHGLSDELAGAIERGELFVLYQPLFALEHGGLTGVEALVRWHHPEHGVLAPVDFVPQAERHGAIALIDAFVLEEACHQLAAWRTEDPSWATCTLAVNLSGHQLRDSTMVQRVQDTLERHHIEPSCLCLEITETALIDELDDARRVTAALSDLGVRIALDDFGSGYSTLLHLQRLHANVLKIDRSFVAQLGHDSRDREVVGAITAMAHALGMTVVGEGVETAAERDDLAAVDCDTGQGYLFARPGPAAEIASLWSQAHAAGPR